MSAQESGLRLSALPGGLRVVTQRMDHAATVTLGVWISAGSRHEREDEHGLAHLLEHMAFKGTARRSAKRIAEEIEAVGGDINAATSIEYTCYTARTLPEDVPLAVDILADILLDSAFDPKELRREKQVILQEIAAVEDTPDDLVYDLFMTRAFAGQPLGRAILGTRKTVRAFDPAAIRGYLARHYVGPHMVLAAAGAVDHDRLVELAARHFSMLPSAPADEPAGSEAAGAYTGGEAIRIEDSDQSHLVLGFQGAPFRDAKHYPHQVLATVLGGGLSSRLFQEVREKRGLAYAIDAFHWPFSDTGVFGIGAGAAPKDVPELTKVALDCLAACAQEVTEAELSRAKAQMKMGLLGAMETPGGRVEQIARHVLAFGRVLRADEIAARIEAVDASQVQAAAAAALASPPTRAMVGPRIAPKRFALARKQASGAS